MSTPSSPELPAVAPAATASSSPLSSPPTVILSPSSTANEPSSPSPQFNVVLSSVGDAEGGELGGELDDASGDSNDHRDDRHVPSRAHRLSRQKKLNAMVQALRDIKWTFQDFILAWAGLDGEQDIRVNHARYHTQRSRRAVLFQAMQTLSTHGICQDGPTSVELCSAELNELIKLPLFAKFDPAMDIERLDYAQAIQLIQETTPTWYNFLRSIMVNTRAPRTSFSAQDKKGAVDRRIFTVTSMACFSRAKHSSNVLPSCLDLYLLGSGVHRRVIETLAGLGLCHTYHSANDLMNQMSKHAAAQLKSHAHDEQTVVVYDNINFMDRKRDEEAGHTAVYTSMTNAAHVLKDIVLSPGITGSDGVGERISASLIADAIRRLHPRAVADVFDSSADEYPEFPVIERLPAKKTQFWQFAGIPADEGTIEGTYQVHDNIFIDQLGLSNSADSLDFDQRLFLVHGDQLTTHHIRAIKQERQHALRAYDRREWIHAVPAWFHMQMNLLNTIIRTHWAPLAYYETDVHCISSDATRWGRSQTNRDNVKYHLMEPIVAQGFTARIAALFYAAMRRRGYLTVRSSICIENVADAIAALSPTQFLQLVEDVRATAFTYSAWQGSTPDVDFRTMCRMLQEVELFLTVRCAVKHGDIGMLRRVVDPLIVVFFGASQHNYGREMLYYRWNLSSANTPELQRAILASGLVNWPGRGSTFKPIDLALEHLNCSCKIDLKNLKNSTHDIDIIFRRSALCNVSLRLLRSQLEGFFGEDMPSTHTSVEAIPDMFFLAWTLFQGDYAEPRDQLLLAGTRMFDSYDIFQAGMDVLEEKVEQFNSEYVRQSTPLGPAAPANDNDYDGFVDIEEYARVVHEGYDAVTDPTFNLGQIPVLDLT